MRVQSNRQDVPFKQNVILYVGVRNLEKSQMTNFLVKKGLTSPNLLFEDVLKKPYEILAVDLSTIEGKMYQLSKLKLENIQPKSEYYKTVEKAKKSSLNSILDNPQIQTIYYDA